MNGNPMDDQILQEILNEVNGFTSGMKQATIGFVNLFSVAMKKLMDDYKNRGLLVQNQQQTIERLNEQISNLEKELGVLRKGVE